MKTRNELLSSIAATIQDYRVDELPKPTPDHVNRWVKQFDEAVQMPLLAEVDHVLDKTYFSKDYVTEFFAYQIANHPLVQGNPRILEADQFSQYSNSWTQSARNTCNIRRYFARSM